jgi:NADPH:quinone reductase-like Zn-dependent oxidoreductase
VELKPNLTPETFWSKLKAVLFREFGGPEKLRYEDVAEPKISETEVLIRVRACGLNHLDIWARQGTRATFLVKSRELGIWSKTTGLATRS